jgi:hypothetical protein
MWRYEKGDDESRGKEEMDGGVEMTMDGSGSEERRLH